MNRRAFMKLAGMGVAAGALGVTGAVVAKPMSLQGVPIIWNNPTADAVVLKDLEKMYERMRWHDRPPIMYWDVESATVRIRLADGKDVPCVD